MGIAEFERGFAYASLKDANRQLMIRRNRALEAMRRLGRNDELKFNADLSPESLLVLEREYFETAAFKDFFEGLPADLDIEWCIACYFGAVIVENCPQFNWKVSENPVWEGYYTLAVERGLVSIHLGLSGGLSERANNSERNSLWRDFKAFTR